MEDCIENPASEFVLHINVLLLASLTWSHQLDFLRYGSAKLVESVAPVFALKGNQVLVQKHKGSMFVFVILCRHIWWLKIFSIFCPPVPNGERGANDCHKSLPRCFVVPLLVVLTLVVGFPSPYTQWLHFGDKEGRWLDLVCDSLLLEAAQLQCEMIKKGTDNCNQIKFINMRHCNTT